MDNPRHDLGFRLSPRQRSVLREMFAYTRAHGIPPTTAILAKSLGIARQTVDDNILVLRRKGFVHSIVGQHRTYRVNEEAVRVESFTRAVLDVLQGAAPDGLSPALVEAIKAEVRTFRFTL